MEILGMPFSTAFAWIGTPVMVILLALVVWWIEDQRDLTEWEGQPIEYEVKKGGEK
ncbi:MAG: hypothetical protein VB106_03780 [Clostridiaceae bacterium]|jgi:hypothetical protein|nr:hypothetical protein [Clostridiaceae bacterium]